MSERVYFTVLIYVKAGQTAVLRQYEQQAAPIMTQYGGQFHQIIVPTDIRPKQMTLPDEIHILSFPSVEAFAQYRQDPANQALAHLRDEAVDRAVFITGKLDNYL